MGLLFHPSVGWRGLRPRHVVGRHTGSDLRLGCPTVSHTHAELQYRAGVWRVRDCGSRNGTFVNDRRIRREVSLRPGDRIAFGRREVPWVLSDASRPRPFAESLARPGVQVQGTDQDLVLPDDVAPALWACRVGDRWVASSDGRERPVVDGEVVDAFGRWRLSLPPELTPATQSSSVEASLADVTLVILVSAELEHIELSVRHPLTGVHRLAHSVANELLLVLARERGWMGLDELGKGPSLDATQLRDRNRIRSWIHRLRCRFESLGIRDGARIVERRAGTGEVRLGLRAVTIEPLPPVS